MAGNKRFKSKSVPKEMSRKALFGKIKTVYYQGYYECDKKACIEAPIVEQKVNVELGGLKNIISVESAILRENILYVTLKFNNKFNQDITRDIHIHIFDHINKNMIIKNILIPKGETSRKFQINV